MESAVLTVSVTASLVLEDCSATSVYQVTLLSVQRDAGWTWKCTLLCISTVLLDIAAIINCVLLSSVCYLDHCQYSTPSALSCSFMHIQSHIKQYILYTFTLS